MRDQSPGRIPFWFHGRFPFSRSRGDKATNARNLRWAVWFATRMALESRRQAA